MFGLGVGQAQTYVGTSVGYFVNDEFVLTSVQIGHQVGDRLRDALTLEIEAEFGYGSTSEMGVDLSLMPIMFNTKFSGRLNPGMRAYAGAGLGFCRMKATYLGYSMTDTSFAMQALAGLRFDLSKSFSVHAGYRYLRVFDVFGAGDADDSTVEIGMRYNF